MKHQFSRLHLVALLLIVSSVVISSCAPAAVATPTARPDAQPSATAAAPRATATPLPAGAPSPTPRPPTPTAVPPTPTPLGGVPQYGGILQVALVGDPGSLDAKAESTINVGDPNRMVYQGMIYRDVYQVSKPFVSGLAERWAISEDGLTMTFNLRKGIKFHKGQDLVADDVVHTFNLYANPPEGWRSTQVGALEPIQKVEAVDPGTVKVTMKRRTAVGLEVASFTVYSKVWLQSGGNPRSDMNGTGPFVLKNWAPGSSLEFVKNSSYWKSGIPYLDGVTYFTIVDPGTRLAALRTGQIKYSSNYFTEITPSQRETLMKENSTIKTWLNPYMFLGMMLPNVQRQPFGDLRVRKAMHLAVDRHELVRSVGEGAGLVCGLLTPGRSPIGIPCEELQKRPGWRPEKEADRAEAKRLLAEAGFPNGFKTTIMTPSIAAFKNNSVFFADQFASIGIQATLDIGEKAVADARGRRQEFDVGFWNQPNTTEDPTYSTQGWYTPDGSQNRNKWVDKNFLDLYYKQDQELDPKKRAELVRQMDEYLMEQLPTIYGAWIAGYLAAWPEVRGYPLNDSGGSQNAMERIWLAR